MTDWRELTKKQKMAHTLAIALFLGLLAVVAIRARDALPGGPRPPGIMDMNIQEPPPAPGFPEPLMRWANGLIPAATGKKLPPEGDQPASTPQYESGPVNPP